MGKARGVSLIFEFGSLQNLAVFKLAVFEGYVFIKSVFIKKTVCIYKVMYDMLYRVLAIVARTRWLQYAHKLTSTRTIPQTKSHN